MSNKARVYTPLEGVLALRGRLLCCCAGDERAAELATTVEGLAWMVGCCTLNSAKSESNFLSTSSVKTAKRSAVCWLCDRVNSFISSRNALTKTMISSVVFFFVRMLW